MRRLNYRMPSVITSPQSQDSWRETLTRLDANPFDDDDDDALQLQPLPNQPRKRHTHTQRRYKGSRRRGRERERREMKSQRREEKMQYVLLPYPTLPVPVGDGGRIITRAKFLQCTEAQQSSPFIFKRRRRKRGKKGDALPLDCAVLRSFFFRASFSSPSAHRFSLSWCYTKEEEFAFSPLHSTV